MACHGERSEGAEVTAVVKRDEAEGNDDQQDGFFVDVPTEEEGSISAESGSCNEIGPCRSEEELDKRRLEKRSVLLGYTRPDWDRLTI